MTGAQRAARALSISAPAMQRGPFLTAAVAARDASRARRNPESAPTTVADRNRNDRIIPDWLGWLALAVAVLLAALVAYFRFN